MLQWTGWLLLPEWREVGEAAGIELSGGTWKGTLELPGGTSLEWREGKIVNAVMEMISTNRAPVLTVIGDRHSHMQFPI